MPPKKLYLGKNVAELNKMAGEIPKVNNVRLFVKSAEKLYKAAVEQDNVHLDEERAYVLYMKFFNIVTAIKKTPEFKKDGKYYGELLGTKNCVKAIERAEKLAASCKDRYEELEAIEVSKRVEVIEQEIAEKKLTDNEKVEEENEESNSDNESDKKVPLAAVTCQELYTLLKNNEKLLLLDVRAKNEFDISQISKGKVISVPCDIVPPGCTTVKIEKNLPAESKDHWHQRAAMDHIVLVDWDGSAEQLESTTPVKCLKDALYKWDQNTILKSEPKILLGGYGDWLMYYPTFTTNSNVKRPDSNNTVGSAIPSLDSIDYDLDLNFLKNPEEEARKKAEARAREQRTNINNQSSLTDKLSNKPAIPMVNRSTKPRAAGTGLNNYDSSNFTLAPQPAETRKPENIPSKITNNLEDLKRILGEEKKSNLPEKNTNLVNQGSVAITNPHVPSVNRSLKPKPGTEMSGLPHQNSTDSDPAGDDASSPGESQTLSSSNSNASLNSTGPELNQDKVNEKESELTEMVSENKRLALEHQARLNTLQREEEEIKRLQDIKNKEAKEMADLLRQKRKIEQEVKEMKEKEDRRQEEELKTHQELETLSKEKDFEKERKDKETERKRLDEFNKAEEEERKRQEIENAEKAEILRTEKLQADERRLKELQLEKEKRELDRSEREEAEIRRREQEERERVEKLAKEKAERERQERLRAVEERKKMDALEQERIRREEKLKKEQEASAKEADQRKLAKEEAKLNTPGIPVGWEKRLDRDTGRYYYINHQAGTTQWQPPERSREASPAKQPGGVYKTKLRNEDAPQSGGLKRSHSSPNIAKMAQDDEEGLGRSSFMHPTPTLDRSAKPKSRTLQITDINAAKVRNLNPTWGSVGRGLTGLRNMGNTCYMNSTLQCLSNTTPLSIYFLTDVFTEDINRENVFGKGGAVAEEYSAVIKALFSGQYKSITPRDFKSTIGRFHSDFAGYQQQDSQEFLLFLMDGLHEDLNRVKKRPKLPEQKNDGVPDETAASKAWQMHKAVHTSIIVDLFQGQFKSSVQCLKCEAKSVTFDAFMYLTLPIGHNTTRCSLHECLLSFSKEEKMTGESRWNCPRCKCRRDAVKRIVIWKLPPVLLIHLKRFYYQGMWRQKITAMVDFPVDNLDMLRYLSGPPTRRDPYQLYAVSNHYGTMEGGHYTAYCKNPESKRWYKYDDHDVYDISNSDIKTPAAYILYYSCIKMDYIK